MSVEEEIMSEVISATDKSQAPSETPETPVQEPAEEISPESTPADDFYKNQYENLQKDYTRKAQELAELKKTNVSKPQPEKAPWEDPAWQPKTWQENVEAAKQAALREIAPALEEYQQAKQQKEFYAATQQAVEAEMTEIKAIDPKVDENSIYNHANKYGFNSLKAAYQNLIDMRGLEKSVQQKVLKNLKDRNADPVGISGPTSPEDDTPTYQEIAGYKSIRSAASAAFRSLTKK